MPHSDLTNEYKFLHDLLATEASETWVDRDILQLPRQNNHLLLGRGTKSFVLDRTTEILKSY